MIYLYLMALLLCSPLSILAMKRPAEESLADVKTKKAKLNPEETSSSEFFEAINQRNTHKIKELCESSPELILKKDFQDWSPLMAAASMNYREGLEIFLGAYDTLVRQGLDSIRGTGGNRLGEVEALFRMARLVINAKNNKGLTALMIAAHKESKDVLRRLLAVPLIDLNAQSDDGATALLWAVRGKKSRSVFILLHDHALITIPDHSGFTPLLMAAKLGSLDIVEQLLQAPAIAINEKVKARDDGDGKEQGMTALTLATLHEHSEVVRRLLNHPGIDIIGVNERNESAFEIAAQTGNLEIVRLLMPHFKAAERNFYEAFWEATAACHIGIVQYMLDEQLVDRDAILGYDEANSLESAIENLANAESEDAQEKARQMIKFVADILMKDQDGKEAVNRYVLNSLTGREYSASIRVLCALGADASGMEEVFKEMSVNVDDQSDFEEDKEEIRDQQRQGQAILENIKKAVETGDEAVLKHYVSQGYSLLIKKREGENNLLHQAVRFNKPKVAAYLAKYNKAWLTEKSSDEMTPIELVYGLWGKTNQEWNEFLEELPPQAGIITTYFVWEDWKDQFFTAGHEGFVEPQS
jgi:ankyrin repeat protein